MKPVYARKSSGYGEKAKRKEIAHSHPKIVSKTFRDIMVKREYVRKSNG